MKKILPVIMLLLIGAGSAMAQPVVTATLSDLLLGFGVNDGVDPGSTQNLEVDLGSIGNFTGLAPNSNFVVANLETALEAIYSIPGGTDWDQRADLDFGIAGTVSAGAGATINGTTYAAATIWGTKLESTPGAQSTPWKTAFATTLRGIANNIATEYTGGTNSLNGKTSTFSGTTTNTASTAVVDATQPGSFTQQSKIGTSSTAYGYFNPASVTPISGFNGATDFTSIVGSFVVLDLYQLSPGSGSSIYVGSFGLNNVGLLEFSNSPGFFAASSIPEPAAVGAMVGTLVLALVLVSRRAKLAGGLGWVGRVGRQMQPGSQEDLGFTQT